MSENQTKEIKFGDINYSIYSIGKWNKEYEINLIGTSSEIPASLPTKKHVILQMEQIRNARFNWQETEVNGMIGLALQLNKKLEEKPVNDLIKQEKKEFEQITRELKNLKLENSKKTIKTDNKEYLVYKLEMEHDGIKPHPATPFTEEYHKKEVDKIKEKSRL